MKIRGTDFVLQPVADLRRAVVFYRDVLGLPLEVYSEEYHWAEFDCGNVTLSLWADGMRAGAPGTVVALAVDDIDAAYAELKAQSASGLEPPHDHGVCHAFRVLDPDGNALLLHRRTDGTFGR